MLAPDSRAVLLDLLRPPAGFDLAQAVATTFTLDLTAALVPPLAFVARGLSRSADSLSLLAATRTVVSKIDVFCQAGQIGVPRSSSRLIDFVAPMVHPVREPRPGHLFHAKAWLLKFAGDGGGTCYRLIIPSRNLTNDASWDTVLSLDGIPGSRPYAGNRPLAAFIASLPDRCIHTLAADRAARIRALAEEIRRAEWELPSGAREMAFHTFGVNGAPARPDFSGYRHLVVSPYLTGGGLSRVVGVQRSNTSIVSRPQSLDVLDPAVVAGAQRFIVNPLADLTQAEVGLADVAEPDPGIPSPTSALGALHAKLIVVERARLAHYFTGSLNTTDAAFTGNVEIMVELVGPCAAFGVDAVLDEDGMGPILEPYEAAGGSESDPLDEAHYRLEEFLRSVATSALVGDVTKVEGGYCIRYRRTGRVAIPEGYRLSVEMYTQPGHAAQIIDSGVIDVEFGPMPLAEVTPFLTAWVRTDEGLTGGTVLMAHLQGDPPERLDEILARQLDTPEKFLQFLAQLLGIEYVALTGTDASGSGSKSGSGWAGSPAVFELLVRSLVDKPRALDTLAGLIPQLAGGDKEPGTSSLPEGFTDLWAAVDGARQQLAQDAS